MGTLDGMTQTRWDALTMAQRDAIREPATPPQYADHLGWRVEITREDGTRERGIVGRSPGWRPCYLLISRRNAIGGYPAPDVANIRRLYKVR